MRYYELEQHEPQRGDIVGIELGDTLIEAVISDVLEDGVVLQLDESAIDLMIKANKQKLSEAPEGNIKSYYDKYDKDNGNDFKATSANVDKMVPPPPAGADVFNQIKSNLAPDDSADDIVKRFYSSSNTMANAPVSKTNVAPAADTTTATDTAPTSPEQPVYKPRREKEFKTMSECENAMDWGISTLRKLPDTIARDLMRAGNETVIAYLRIIARRTNAYDSYNFDEGDFEHCEDYLSSALEDATIDNWAGVLKNNTLSEAKYQGREVPLGKRMAGDVKKSKVYVKGPKGNVVKVNFGDPNMRIKKSSPKHRKSFRARHNCDNPGPRWKARYWSCRAW
jgi:hypothetical protein